MRSKRSLRLAGSTGFSANGLVSYPVMTRPKTTRSFLIETAAVVLPFICVSVGMYRLQSAWAAILLYHAGIVLLLAAAGSGDVKRLVRTGFRPGRVLLILLACALAGVGIVGFWPWMGRESLALGDRLSFFGLDGASLYLFLAYFSLIHPVLEELHWRGTLFVTEGAPTGRDAAFGAYHVLVLLVFVKPMWILLAFVTLTTVAWMWRRAAHRAGGLAIPVVSHMVADVSVAVAVLALCR